MVRATRDSWIDEAMRILEHDGPSGLTIERLCTALQKTKGSFYHHFRDAAGLRTALLDRWEERQTEAVIAEADREPDIRRRAKRLDQLATAANWAHERAIRGWAWQDRDVRLRVDAVDRRRVEYLMAFYPEVPPELAQTLALIEYAALVGAQHLFLDDLPDEDAAALGRVLRRALRRVATAGTEQ